MSNLHYYFSTPETDRAPLYRPEELAGGEGGAADWREGQEGRGCPDLPPEPQEGEGEGRGLPQDADLPHQPPMVGVTYCISTDCFISVRKAEQ